jgi:hypothetical protein
MESYMRITLHPGEMLSNIKSTREDSDITILFLSEWDYGDVIVVNDEEFVTGYKRGDTRIYPGDSEINIANGSTSIMQLEIITMQ